MDLTNTAAFEPFLKSKITLKERTPSGWTSADISAACVGDADSTASMLGLANGWNVSVIFKISEYPTLPSPGSRIPASSAGEWDELTVAKSYHQGGLTYLLCTTKELPV